MRSVVVLVALVACGESAAQPVAPAPSASVATVAPQADCGVTEEPYRPHPAWSGRPSALADPPSLPDLPQRVGGAFTVYGAVRALGRIDQSELARPVTIVGYIVDTNLGRAPRCALHRTGVADPPHCVTEIPTFSIADTKGAPAASPRIRVMGWASNFANVFEASRTRGPYADELWGVQVPNPLPAVGAKVKVTGRYGVNFSRASSGIVSDPARGILTADRVETLEPAPAPAKLGH